MYCSSCGSLINEGQSFCANCGAPVAPAVVQETPVVQAQPVAQPTVAAQPIAQPRVQAQPQFAQPQAQFAPQPQFAPQAQPQMQPAAPTPNAAGFPDDDLPF